MVQQLPAVGTFHRLETLIPEAPGQQFPHFRIIFGDQYTRVPNQFIGGAFNP
jgi:hypothetical protein